MIRKLRALWALHVTEGFTDEYLMDLLNNDNEHIRSWAIQLMAEDKELSKKALDKLAGLAQNDSSALVRLYITSALERTEPDEARWNILEGLYAHAEDAEDHNLPLMIWYAAAPVVEKDMERAMDMAMNTELPDILPYTIKHLAAIGTKQAMQTLEKAEQNIQNKPDSDRYEQARKELNLALGHTTD